jgi:hypothetical protein
LNDELKAIFDADQADRQCDARWIDWNLVGPRDEARRKRVRAIVDGGGARCAADWYHAAMVFQHGQEVDAIRTARAFALEALALDATHGDARWLVAAAEDRELMYLGKPQRWGTQFRANDEGLWELYNYDRTVTDAERAQWNVPTLAHQLARAAEMNTRR